MLIKTPSEGGTRHHFRVFLQEGGVTQTRRGFTAATDGVIRGWCARPLTPSTAARAEYGLQSDLTKGLPDADTGSRWYATLHVTVSPLGAN